MMENNHLREEVLQAYVLKELQDDKVAQHLTVCPECRKRLEEYQKVLTGVENIQIEPFPFDVTAMAMDAIGVYERRKSKKHELVFWSILILIFLIISSLAFPYLPVLHKVFSRQSLSSSLLVFGSGLMVFLFLAIDLYRQYQSRNKKLLKDYLQPTI